MILADLGAEVILVERQSKNPNAPEVEAQITGSTAFYKRSKKSIALDLKQPESVVTVLQLVESADVLIEGFRPGVMERLGLGPEVCLAVNPALVYGRMTGWGQTGPLASAAGHDINYIALSGALYYTGHQGEAPFTPPTVVGDVAGGAMTLAIGIMAALLHARGSGEGWPRCVVPAF
jgi:acetyl-CoA hydrolase